MKNWWQTMSKKEQNKLMIILRINQNMETSHVAVGVT